MGITINDLINNINYLSEVDINEVLKAYHIAKALHSNGKPRMSGEAYITHPLSVAIILAEMHADKDTVIAGLLHDTVEDVEHFKIEMVEKLFNQDVAILVDGVTKISNMEISNKVAKNLANMRKQLNSIKKDPRILIIKLADRLHNMRTLMYQPKNKQIENAEETRDFFIPLAESLGMHKIKNELEDLVFRYLEPEKYAEYKARHDLYIENSNDILIKWADKIHSFLEDKGIPNHAKVRIRNLYSIFQREKENKGRKLNIHRALKIIVDSVDECYKAMDYLYLLDDALYQEDKTIIGKDYIKQPLPNGYRGRHSIFVIDNHLIQLRINSENMELFNEYGIASCWMHEYQTNVKEIMLSMLKETEFFRILDEYNRLYPTNERFIASVNKDLLGQKIIVYTPKFKSIYLPVGSKPMDFAYRIHTDIGQQMAGAKVNGELVSFDYELQDGDQVEILVNELVNPTVDSYAFCYTTYAKNCIRKFLSKVDISKKEAHKEKKLV